MSARPPRRIVSFLASGTEILVALGLEDRIVGISHECDHPQHVLDRPRLSRPRFDPTGLDSGQVDAAVRAAMQEFGSVYEVDAALLSELEPDMILTQAVCEVCAVPTPGVRALAGEMGITANIVSLDAHTVEEILSSIIQVANAAGVPERGQTVVGELRARIDAVRSAVAGAARRRALAIEWLDPPFTPGHWVPEMIEAAAGTCLVGSAGGHSEQVGWDAMSGLDPDVLLIMPCGYDVAKSRADADAHSERLAAAAPRALADGNAFVVNGSAYFNRSGPRFVHGIEILAGLFHPDRWPQPQPDDAVRWQPRTLQGANP
jgi:iron complex transport system substrate-binding protein